MPIDRPINSNPGVVIDAAAQKGVDSLYTCGITRAAGDDDSAGLFFRLSFFFLLVPRGKSKWIERGGWKCESSWSSPLGYFGVMAFTAASPSSSAVGPAVRSIRNCNLIRKYIDTPGAAEEVLIKSDGAARELQPTRRRGGGQGCRPATMAKKKKGGGGLSSVRKQKTDVGAIFTTFDESEGARTAHSINDSTEASYITFMTPIFIFIFHICISLSLSLVYIYICVVCLCVLWAMALNPLAAQVVQLATVGYHTEEFSLASPRKTKKRFSEKKLHPYGVVNQTVLMAN